MSFFHLGQILCRRLPNSVAHLPQILARRQNHDSTKLTKELLRTYAEGGQVEPVFGGILRLKNCSFGSAFFHFLKAS